MFDYFLELHHVSRYGLIMILISLVLLPCIFYYRILIVEQILDFDHQIRKANTIIKFNRVLWILLGLGAGMMLYGAKLSVSYLIAGRELGKRDWNGVWELEPDTTLFTPCKDFGLGTNLHRFNKLMVDAVSLKRAGVILFKISFFGDRNTLKAVIVEPKILDKTEYGETLKGSIIMVDSGLSFPVEIHLLSVVSSSLSIYVDYGCDKILYKSFKEDPKSIRLIKFGF